MPLPLLTRRGDTLYYDTDRGAVMVLDRRRYPQTTEFVACSSVEEVAHAIEKAGSRDFPDFRPDLFVLLASDPLVPCAGPPGSVCPHGRMMRMRFHNSASPDGRSLLWQRRAPYGKIRCVSCGGPQFSIPTKGAA